MENKIKFKKILFFIILTLVFSLIIFLMKSFFIDSEKIINENIEEKYIEPIALDSPRESLYDKLLKNRKKVISEKTEIEKVEVNYSFFPSKFREDKDANKYKNILDYFFSSNIINKKLTFLDINLYEKKGEVRGKMKNAKVHLFGILFMSPKEILAVNIHEFGHFLDLYILRRKNNFDESNIFYNISWQSTLVLKKGQSQKDFVSGYSMTNKYEDFAESFAYYILHNKDFLEKAKKSEFLTKKYIFFKNYIFKENEFVNFNDGKKEKIKDYYRDITKINYNLEDFLKYLKYFGEVSNEKFLEKTFGV